MPLVGAERNKYMKISRKIICIFSTALFLFSLSTNSFATNKYFNRGYNYSASIYEYNVSLVNYFGYEKITVVNTCDCPLDIQFDGMYYTTLEQKGNEYTISYWRGGKHRVTIQPRGNTTHSFRIKTTGNYDTITKIR